MTGDKDDAATILGEFNRVGDAILGELRGLHAELRRRPTRTEQTVRRRFTVVLLLVLGWCALMVNDYHVATCSPGARAASALDYVAHTPPKSFRAEEMQGLMRDPLPAGCDLAYPTEAHEYGVQWPTPGNVLGLGIYLAILLGLYFWYRWPLIRRPEEDDI